MQIMTSVYRILKKRERKLKRKTNKPKKKTRMKITKRSWDTKYNYVYY